MGKNRTPCIQRRYIDPTVPLPSFVRTANKKEIRLASIMTRECTVSPFKENILLSIAGIKDKRGTVYRSTLIAKLYPRGYTGNWSRGLRSALSMIKLVEHSATKRALPLIYSHLIDSIHIRKSFEHASL